MRRPLFGNGVPQAVVAADTPLTVLDLRPLSTEAKNRVHALTLYAILGPKFAGGAGDGGTYKASVTDGTTTTDIYTQNTGGSVGSTQIVQLLDRYLLRGDVAVTVEQDVAPADQPIFYLGYFQLEGESPIPVVYRPLQPDPQTVETKYLPAHIDGAGGPVLLHAFTDAYIDEVELHVRATGPLSSFLLIGDGVTAVSIKILTPTAAPGGWQKILDGIPMRGTAGGLDGGGILLNNTDAADESWAYGKFQRG